MRAFPFTLFRSDCPLSLSLSSVPFSVSLESCYALVSHALRYPVFPLPTLPFRSVSAVMFGRRVAASCAIPKNMYSRLSINSTRQANHMLPAMVPVTSLVARSAFLSSAVMLSLACSMEALPLDVLGPTNLAAALGLSPAALLTTVNTNPFLIRMISDTMSTYRVVTPH